jgi:hypothetical protein
MYIANNTLNLKNQFQTQIILKTTAPLSPQITTVKASSKHR